jgi:benzoyl-CoA reductase/2-hydroxyglutaryl-CoA dehydratase subunit BcrC/BadD/HgdB
MHMAKKDGTKNKLMDLNNHLFAQLERLSDEETTGDKLNEEIERAKSVGGVARMIIDNARLALEAQKLLYDKVPELPAMIGIAHKEDVGEGDLR